MARSIRPSRSGGSSSRTAGRDEEVMAYRTSGRSAHISTIGHPARRRNAARYNRCMRIALWLHLTGVVIWVGGMFFAHMALRPSVQALQPAERLTLLSATLTRFVSWVAGAVLAIVGSGFWMVAMLGGFSAANHWIAAMASAGLVMVAIYVWLVAGPFRLLRAKVAASDW